MAITKIFAVRSRLDDSIKYATNAEKTSAEVLEGKIEYALNREKTEKQIYETALNCFSASTAYSEMHRTKEKWHKTGGVLGYHFIQSFKPKEATPETVHEIGVEFARRCFGERFEVVIGTHLDRNHLHNHIVVNSVSFADGKKYHSNAKSYFGDIRKISDEICREYGLSVIEPQKKGIPYGVLHAEKNGKQTVRSQIRADIDEVIEVSLNFTVFLELLKKRGYTVKYQNVKHTAVKPPYSKRFIRLDSLGEGYNDTEIAERILTQAMQKRKTPQQSVVLFRLYNTKGKRYGIRRTKRKAKITGFAALYFRYLYLLRGRKTPRTRRLSYFMLEENTKFERYLKQHRFLQTHNINSMESLMVFQAEMQNRHDENLKKRKRLQYKMRTEGESETLQAEISKLSQKIREEAFCIRMCRQIEKDAEKIEERLYQAEEIREEEKEHEPRQRGSRTNDKRGSKAIGRSS